MHDFSKKEKEEKKERERERERESFQLFHRSIKGLVYKDDDFILANLTY